MNLRTSTITGILAASLLAPAAASAGAAKASPTHTAKGSTIRSKASAPALRSSTLVTLSTPSGSYVHMPTTPATPSTYFNVGACQLTGDCAPAVDGGDGLNYS